VGLILVARQKFYRAKNSFSPRFLAPRFYPAPLLTVLVFPIPTRPKGSAFLRIFNPAPVLEVDYLLPFLGRENYLLTATLFLSLFPPTLSVGFLKAEPLRVGGWEVKRLLKTRATPQNI
jgi:hypothetical protein